VEKFIDHSNILLSSQTPTLNIFHPSNSSQSNNDQFSNSNQPNQAIPGPQALNANQIISSTENFSFDNSRSFSETSNNQIYNQEKVENENIPSTQKPENQNPWSVSATSKSVIDNTLQIKEDQGLIKKSLLVSLFLLFFAGIIIVFSLQRKNKKLKS
jgi:hypothetical protein